MMRPLRLTSADNPRIKSVVKLRDHAARRKTGLFVAEGHREITRALAAGLTLREVYDCPDLPGSASLDWRALLPDEAHRQEVRWYELPASLLAKIAYKQRPEGVVAIFDQPQWSWDALTPAPGRAPLYLVAVGVAKPGNLGAMARSAAAAGVDALLVADGVVDAMNPNAIRASTGAVFGLPILGETSQRVRAFLSHQGVKAYTASPTATLDYTQADLRGPSAVVIGAEDVGLDDAWLAAGVGVNIPMADTPWVDSLNASIAAGVLLFEAARQRRLG